MINEEIQKAASNIKALVTDVDGVLTDGSLTFDENGVEYKTFNAKDGQGIVMLNKTGHIFINLQHCLFAFLRNVFKVFSCCKGFINNRVKFIHQSFSIIAQKFALRRKLRN